MIPAPLVHEGRVLPEWVDYNGHMNVAHYVAAFERAVDDLYDRLGIGSAYARKRGLSMFAVGADIDWLRELREGETYVIRTQLLDHDDKRLFYHQTMLRGDGTPAARITWLALHVDLGARRAVPFPPDRLDAVRAAVAAHRHLPPPEGVGRRLGVRRPCGAARAD